MLDRQARNAYRRHLGDLREDLAEAELHHDLGRMAALREEIEIVTDQLAAAVGLRGRSRKASSAAERARLTATKQIKDALRRIAKQHPALGHSLGAVIKTGYLCSYRPDPSCSITWVL